MRVLHVSAGWARIGIGVLAVGLSLSLAAEASAQRATPARRADAGLVNAVTAKRLSAAIEKLDVGAPAEAREILVRIDRTDLSPYEASRVAQVMAAIEQADAHYAAARTELEAAIASGGLNDPEIQSARYQIAQLLLAEERWDEGVKAIEVWLAAVAAPSPDAFHLLALARYQSGDAAGALEPAQLAVDRSPAPPESWLSLLLALRLDREEYALVAPVARQLVDRAPQKRTYWLQLASLYVSQGETARAAVALQLAERLGVLTEQVDSRQTAEVLAQAGLPHRAARQLQLAIDSGRFAPEARTLELLGTCYAASHDDGAAIRVLEKAASDLGRGDLYLRAAELHLDDEAWSSAATLVERAIAQGGLPNPARAHLLLGIALTAQGRLADAKPWLERATQSKATATEAAGWLAHLAQLSAAR